MITISCIKMYSQNSISIYLSRKSIFSNPERMSRKKSVCQEGCTNVAFFVPFADYSSRKEEGKKIY